MLLDRDESAPVSPVAQKTRAPRRRASRAGTRCVSALTSVQLERKRANDREAQKATRRRTKAYIESLEAQIAELAVSQERAQSALWLNKKLELENAELRLQLHSAEVLFRTGDRDGVPERDLARDDAGRSEWWPK
ncbi:MAG: hypothetical protein M1839_008220 [Geoglossum umbratile]|nr:MAG: hypothetical protein M1839_008220 [Geoglossum umbratile]